MGKRNRRQHREQRELKKKKGEFAKAKSNKPHPDPVRDLNDKLRLLKEELELTPLISYDADDLGPSIRPSDVLWQTNVIEFTDGFHEPVSYFKDVPTGRALLYNQAWNVFSSELWSKVEGMLDTPDSVEYFNAWMKRKAEGAWQTANGTFERVPADLVIEVDDESTVTEVFEMLMGRKRVEHIWWDQLLWACDYLKVAITM